MKVFQASVVAFAVAMIASGSAQAADPFVNGNFQDGLTGWYDASGSVTPLVGATLGGPSGSVAGSAVDNKYAVLTDPDGTGARMFQEFDGLLNNTSYTVSFDAWGLGYSRIGLNDVNGSLGYGVNHAALTGVEDTHLGNAEEFGIASPLSPVNEQRTWQHYSYTFNSGAAAQWDLWFKSEASTTLRVDNVTLGLTPATAVPEPEGYAMMLAGLGALGFLARRRKN